MLSAQRCLLGWQRSTRERKKNDTHIKLVKVLSFAAVYEKKYKEYFDSCLQLYSCTVSPLLAVWKEKERKKEREAHTSK